MPLWDPAKRLVLAIVRPLAHFFLRHWIRHDELVRVRQEIRYLALGQLLGRTDKKPIDLTLYELSVFSQNGEDGVLHEIVSRIGAPVRFFVEIGASNNEANCLLLADVLGWQGLFLDADPAEVAQLEKRYWAKREVRAECHTVTGDNISQLLIANDVPQDLSVLSIDVDGNDYWLWKGLTEFRPRVVVIEYNSSLSSDKPWVQPNQPGSVWDNTEDFGASLSALIELAESKGYRLVHAEITGTNAFFVRADLAENHFLATDQISRRVPNFYLYGLMHRQSPRRMHYVNTSESQPEVRND